MKQKTEQIAKLIVDQEVMYPLEVIDVMNKLNEVIDAINDIHKILEKSSRPNNPKLR